MKLYRKYIKRILVFSLILLMAGESVFGVYAAGSGSDAKKSEKKELSELEEQRQQTIDEINNLKDSIGDVQDEIRDLRTEKNTIQSYIKRLDEKNNTITSEIKKFEKKINEKAEDIEKTKAELEEARIACDEQYKTMKMRIQFIYECSGQSLLEILLTSESLGEVLNRADYVFRMSDYEKKMMDRLVATKEEIALKEETLQAEYEELEMMQQEMEAQKAEVGASIDSKMKELNSKATELKDANAEQDDYEKQLEEQEKLLDEIEEQIARAADPDIYEGSTTGFIWPCPGYQRISSYFGPRPQPVPGASTNHKGVDLAAPYGTDILASAAGVVTTSQYSSSAGNYIVIAHGNGISTVYMHASSLCVSVGETVEQGQVIAKVGSTGYSSGNHLHFGVIKNGVYVDPLGYVSP